MYARFATADANKDGRLSRDEVKDSRLASRFDALDGSRLNGPAMHGLAAVDVPAPAPETARAPPSVRM